MKNFIFLLFIGLLLSCSEQSSQDHIAAAKVNIKANDYNAASIQLKNAIKISPKLPEARYLLGKVYLKNKNYQSAEKELNKALELNYPASEVLPLLSAAYKNTKSDVALLELSHNVKGLSPEEQAEISFYKIQAMFRLEQNEKAKALVEEVQKIATESEFKTLAFVYSLLLDSQIDVAQEQLTIILENHPKQADALKLLAVIALRKGEKDLAANTYANYLSYYPEDLEIAFISARILVELNRTQEAEPIIDKLLLINQENGLLNQLKGIARFNDKDNEKALFHTEKAIIASPSDPALRLLAGYSAFRLDKYEITHQHLSIIAEQLPSTHEALRLLAVSQLRLGLAKEAGETVNSLSELSDKDNALVSSVGLALVKGGEVKQAKEILSRSNKLAANTAEDLTRLGLLKLSLNDIEGITNLELALDKKPQQKVTRNTLATAYLTTKQYDKALDLAERWKAKDVNDIQAYILAGSVYLQQKDLDRAKREYQQILSFDENHIGARLALIDIAYQDKDFSVVKTSLEEILTIDPSHIPSLIKFYRFEFEHGEPSSIISFIEEQYKKDSENKGLQLLMAKVYLQEGNPNKTIELLNGFDTKDAPKIYWQTLGQAFFKLKDFTNVQKHYQDWLEQAPNDRDAIMSNLLLFDNQRKYKKALELSSKYLENRPGDVEISLLDIHFLLVTGDFESAKKQLLSIPEQAKQLPFTKGLIGQLQMHNKEYAKALINIQEAYNAQQTSRNVSLIYICLINTGQQKQGYSFLQDHVKTHSNDIVSYMKLAQIQINTDTEAAIKSYEHVLTISENNFVALNNLAYFYLERNQLEKALEHATKSLNLQPNMPDVLDTIGRIYMAKKDYETAVKHLSKAVNESDAIEDIYLNYIEALLLNNNKALAQRKMDQKSFESPQSIAKAKELKALYKLN